MCALGRGSHGRDLASARGVDGVSLISIAVPFYFYPAVSLVLETDLVTWGGVVGDMYYANRQCSLSGNDAQRGLGIRLIRLATRATRRRDFSSRIPHSNAILSLNDFQVSLYHHLTLHDDRIHSLDILHTLRDLLLTPRFDSHHHPHHAPSDDAISWSSP
jgi:hypothetical protein